MKKHLLLITEEDLLHMKLFTKFAADPIEQL